MADTAAPPEIAAKVDADTRRGCSSDRAKAPCSSVSAPASACAVAALRDQGKRLKRRVDALATQATTTMSARGFVVDIAVSAADVDAGEGCDRVTRSPALPVWANGGHSNGNDDVVVTRAGTLSSEEAKARSDASFLGMTTAMNKGMASSEREAPFSVDQGASKRVRLSPFLQSNSTPFFKPFAGAAVRDANGFLAADRITPEEQFRAVKEGSQNLMESLSISQQNTQDCTQTLEESPTMCVMRLVLHPEADRILTPLQRSRLKEHGLYCIEIHRQSAQKILGRDTFMPIFDRRTSEVDPVRLSRKHCSIDCKQSFGTNRSSVEITDRSRNGVRVDGVRLEANKPWRLEHGQTITLLSTSKATVAIGYVVEDPHVKNVMLKTPLPTVHEASAGRSQEESQQRETKERMLGVLFSAPLVGKDVQGKYHPIAELDIKREYSILKQSLKEAARYGEQQVGMNKDHLSGQAKDFVQFPHPISVCAKFATTENFRMMVTLGCRALHFSGHGDERHLYFEDGMGLVHPIPHRSLQELFSAGGSGESTVRLAFVSACSSAPLANAFVSCGIPHVIGVKMSQKIEDCAAIEFTRSFYFALASGKSVGASFSIAQESVAKSPNIRGPAEVAEKFLLLPEDGDHSEVIFPLVTVETNINGEPVIPKRKNYPKLWFSDLPVVRQGFCNRAVEVYKICLALMLTQSRITRLLTICGEEGIGKTAVAHAVANYVGPRTSSEGGVKFFSVAQLAQTEMDENTGKVEQGDRLENALCRLMPRLNAAIREHLHKYKAKLEDRDHQMLLVLDGCDCLFSSNIRRERFRVFLSDLLTNNASLKVVLTARTCISTDGAVAGHGERVYSLSRFNGKMSAKMLLNVVSRPIRVEEVKRAQLVGKTNDKLELIASHPALLATLGIPKRIADLAGRLNEVLMDDVSADEASVEMTE